MAAACLASHLHSEVLGSGHHAINKGLGTYLRLELDFLQCLPDKLQAN